MSTETRPSLVAVPPGIARVVLEATLDATDGWRIDSAEDQRRLARRVSHAVVRAIEDRWAEILRAELSRAWAGTTSPGRWDSRRWHLARLVANRLPAVVVAQSVSRMVVETEHPDDPNLLSVPIGEYTRRWAARYRSCA